MIDAPKKYLGQHWLHDVASLQAMCNGAEIGPDDTVLEIGPGLGTLTTELTKRAKQVIAVEFDQDLAAGLAARVPAKNLQVVQGDILDFDLRQLPPNYKVAANVPYYITSKIVRLLLESPNPPLVTALLVQKEVAQRMAAQPGNMSVLAIATQFYSVPELRELVPAHLFTPPPKVDSQIIKLTRRDNPLFDDISSTEYFKVVKAGFSEKRKKLRSSLSGALHMEKSVIDDMLDQAHISPDARAQELGLGDWYRLGKSAQMKDAS